MHIAPLLQPYPGTATTFEILEGMLLEAENRRVTLVSAWGKRSAFRRLESAATTFRSRGGFLTVVVGLSQGGASKEGLEAALEIADEAYVVFDPSGRTFHPKMYVATGANTFQILIGSSNLTASGMATNYEANTITRGLLSESVDREYFDSCNIFIQTLIGDTGITKRLDSHLIQLIEEDPQISLSKEYASENAVKGRPTARTGLFSRSRHPLATATPTPRETRIENSLSVQNTRAAPLRSWTPLADTVLLWSKQITKANSMRTAAHPTGHLSLTKSTYAINPATWFRDVLFAECEWVPVVNKGRLREQCLIDFEVRGLFADPTTIPLQIDHTPSWNSDQGNRTTSLRWGPLMRTLRNDVDINHSHVVIEKSETGHFTLSIAEVM